MSDDFIDWEKVARKYNIESGEKDATIAALQAEVERLKADNLKLDDQITSMLLLDRIQKGLTSVHELRTRAEKAEADNTALRTRLAVAEKTVEGVRHVVRLVKSKELDYLGGYLALENITEEKILGEP